MDPALVLFLVIAVVFGITLGLVERKAKLRRSNSTRRNRQIGAYSEADDGQGHLPYRVRNTLLSQAELRFYPRLMETVGDRATVCPKVRLADILDVDTGQTMQRQAHLNRIISKHVDFLLCEPLSMRLLAGIELDDRSHQRADRQERDELVDRIFETVGLPLLHIPVRSHYALEDLQSEIGRYLASPPPHTQAANPPVVLRSENADQSEPPNCPKCGSVMSRRVAKSGEHAGKHFWGCTAYPACRGVLPYKIPVS